MKNVLLLSVFIAYCFFAKAQEGLVSRFITIYPIIKPTTLVVTNAKYAFNTTQWAVVKDTSLYTEFFGIIKNKFTNNQQVNQVRVLGWWTNDHQQLVYIYACDVVNEMGKKNTLVLLTAYDGQLGKLMDEELFTHNPLDTDLIGKITTTHRFAINKLGAITLTSIYKNKKGKTVKIIKQCYVDELGEITENKK